MPVTLSAAKGLARWTERSFAALRMTSLGFCHPERSEGSQVHSSSQPASRGLADFWGITS